MSKSTDANRAVDAELRAAYESKTDQYFGGARPDYVSMLPHNPEARVLEIGCSFGGTGELALAAGKCREYIGVETSERAARLARHKLTDVIVGNIESIDLPWPEDTFDALLISEVLEHLINPWRVLERLYPVLRSGGLVFASSPNVSHYNVITDLISGRWELTDIGVMDRTHLRWFTPQSYRRLFEQAGFVVDCLGPVVPFSKKARIFNLITMRNFSHLLMRQINIIAHKPISNLKPLSDS